MLEGRRSSRLWRGGGRRVSSWRYGPHVAPEKCVVWRVMRGDGWREVHGELVRLARLRGAYDADEARWLIEGKRVRVHEPLGHGSYLQYLEHVFGYGPRQASERLRVAEALAGLPGLMEALAENELSWSAVREWCESSCREPRRPGSKRRAAGACARSRSSCRGGSQAIGRVILQILERFATCFGSSCPRTPWPHSAMRGAASSSTPERRSTTTPRCGCSPTMSSGVPLIRDAPPIRWR